MYEKKYGNGTLNIIISVTFDEIHFADNEMHSNWYDGRYCLYSLRINAKNINAIRADAFIATAFQKLFYLKLITDQRPVQIHVDAFRGMGALVHLKFDAKGVQSIPAGIFDPMANSIGKLYLVEWPNNANMNEMGAHVVYRALSVLDIRHVQSPQTKFRRLTAANFTAFRRLKELYLLNCGIEAISEHAFDVVGRTLVYVHLAKNRIKFINLAMIRQIFESKRDVRFRLSGQVVLACTCALIELEIMCFPFRDTTLMDIECALFEKPIDAITCGLHRDVDLHKLCIDGNKNMIMRTVDIRLVVHEAGKISIRTNFGSEIRLIIASIDSTSNQCTQRASKTNYHCLKTDPYVDLLELIQRSELISITAIPILYRFGARPMHLITVRHPSVDESLLCDIWAWITFISITLASFGTGSLIAIVWTATQSRRRDEAEAKADAHDHEHYHYYHDIQTHRDGDDDSLESGFGFDEQVYYEQFERDALPNDYI